ncbi:MAG: hypothetical protein RL591_1812 [Planctomycetota bacterium]
MGASCACVPLATTSCCAGGSATRNDHQLRCPSLRLRCAPPSAASRAARARASESGGRGEAAPPQVASAAPTCLGPRGFTPSEADESERRRAPEAKLQQPASCERSNNVTRRRSACGHHRGSARFALVRRALMPSQHHSPRSRGSASHHHR